MDLSPDGDGLRLGSIISLRDNLFGIASSTGSLLVTEGLAEKAREEAAESISAERHTMTRP